MRGGMGVTAPDTASTWAGMFPRDSHHPLPILLNNPTSAPGKGWWGVLHGPGVCHSLLGCMLGSSCVLLLPWEGEAASPSYPWVISQHPWVTSHLPWRHLQKGFWGSHIHQAATSFVQGLVLMKEGKKPKLNPSGEGSVASPSCCCPAPGAGLQGVGDGAGWEHGG